MTHDRSRGFTKVTVVTLEEALVWFALYSPYVVYCHTVVCTVESWKSRFCIVMLLLIVVPVFSGLVPGRPKAPEARQYGTTRRFRACTGGLRS